VKTVAVHSHGCKLNQFEGEAIAESFNKAGFEIIHDGSGRVPDIIIVNTCTVTEKSDRKSRNTILKSSRIKRDDGLLVVTGCYAQTNPGAIETIEGVDLVVGTDKKPHILKIVQAYLGRSGLNEVQPASPFCYSDPMHPQRSRAFVKIQDGCSGSCAYCKVPMARGRSKSRDPDEIQSYVRTLNELGYREVVLTGINLGDYNWKETTLSGLLALLLKSTQNLRIRLSSIEPPHFGEELFSIIGDERIAPHFHIPLQSGSNRILRLMKRPYSAADFRRIVTSVKKARPHSHIATDVIVGFPTEHEEDFKSTVKCIEDIGFASLHVFKYSRREGTGMARVDDDVSYQEKSRRSNQLITLGERSNYRYRSLFLGKMLPAIFERNSRGWEGVTDNYIKVRLDACQINDLDRKLLPVIITQVENRATYGTLA
jgi:threonylcarbamoyladenosine tRNA methylthiotransferase MtaB